MGVLGKSGWVGIGLILLVAGILLKTGLIQWLLDLMGVLLIIAGVIITIVGLVGLITGKKT
ncbi:MAG: hypothetical protein CMJ45_14595 [Planctomyces sp.]|jgi:hypothetical protein|nr:hypothetical protein [Planctomyces sp.]